MIWRTNFGGFHGRKRWGAASDRVLAGEGGQLSVLDDCGDHLLVPAQEGAACRRRAARLHRGCGQRCRCTRRQGSRVDAQPNFQLRGELRRECAHASALGNGMRLDLCGVLDPSADRHDPGDTRAADARVPVCVWLGQAASDQKAQERGARRCLPLNGHTPKQVSLPQRPFMLRKRCGRSFLLTEKLIWDSMM